MEQEKCVLPVNGNSYHTPEGLFECEVIEKGYSEYGVDVVKVEVRLKNTRDVSQPVRLFTIIGKRKKIEKSRLSLVFDVHKWALLPRHKGEYLKKETFV